MTKCHAAKCDKPAELRLWVGNEYSFKDRWAGGLEYCENHANQLGSVWALKGLRIRIEEVDQASRDGLSRSGVAGNALTTSPQTIGPDSVS